MTRSAVRTTFPCYPPDKKTPANLIYSWGVEMFRLGFEAGFDLAEKLLNMEVAPDESVCD